MNNAIVLNNPSGRFFPGGVVQGKVFWILEESVEIKGLQIFLKGEEHTSWKTYENYYDDVYKETTYGNVEYSGHKEFLNNDINLVAEGSYGPGTLEYPFSFTLPSDCPGTYTTEHGDIRYYIKLIVDQALPPNYEKQLDLFIVAPINFNSIPDLVMSPTQYEGDNSLCCCCWQQGSITMKLYMEKEAYVLGDLIKFTVNFHNVSSESIMWLETSLKMVIKETATSPQNAEKYSEQVLVTNRDTNVEVKRLEFKIYESTLLVPLNVVLPNFSSSSLFQTWFMLQVDAVISGCHDNITLKPKITLGHIARDDGTETTQAVYRELIAQQIFPSGNQIPTPMVMPVPITTPPYPLGRPEIGLVPPGEMPSPYPLGFATPYLPTTASETYPPPRAPEKEHLLTPTDEQFLPPSYFEAVYSKLVEPPPPPPP